ncbi:upstream activation factor subunit spp27-like [Plakobranchus ocellatus]|uniref:Upstream activation factor subunit spp27-like n=1 Tax=Plakobranchus ocellatus TaxID=259542 RepID=A0AAV4DAC0_9GAST|nr:upstream activation factor subunit spp27-like [Plakobranchus ocellatus]
MADTSVNDLKKAIKGILKGADLDNLSAKKVRKLLEDKFSADFSERKKEIDKLVMKMITELEDEDNESEAEEDGQNGKGGSEDEASETEVPKKKQKKSTSSSKQTKPDKSEKPEKKRKSATKADDSEDPVMSSIKQMDDEDLAKKLQEEETGLRRRAARGPPPKPRKEKEKDPNKKKKPSLYTRPCQLSEELSAVVGANEMPRPEVVKTLWSIVREKNLQDPENKQFMICDSQMESLFGLKRVKLFGMMKYLKKHIKDLPR